MSNTHAFDKLVFVKRLNKISENAKAQEIADRIHCDVSKVNNWRAQSKETRPTLDDILALADEYGCTTDYLLGREEDMPKKDLSVKDVCKMIVAIGKRYPLDLKPIKEDVNEFDEIYVNEYRKADPSYRPGQKRILISFSPHAEYVLPSPYFPYIDDGLYTDMTLAGCYLNEFLENYAKYLDVVQTWPELQKAAFSELMDHIHEDHAPRYDRKVDE